MKVNNFNIFDKLCKKYIDKHKYVKIKESKDLSQIENSDLIIIDKDISSFSSIHKVISMSNKKLNNNGILIGYSEINSNNKNFLNIFYPIFPKLIFYIVNKFNINIKWNLTKTEILGRLFYLGFDVKYVYDYNNIIYFIAHKKVDAFDKQEEFPSLTIKLERLGKNNKIIYVYKLRTMLPYSQYIQSYIQSEQGLAELGKISNDYRITKMGYVLRKYWIDELPMIINLIKGDLKLFGVRPISKVAFDLRPKELQALRKQIKPGLIPPLGKDLDDVINKEISYIREYLKKPLLTDIKYLYKTLKDIFIKGMRSK